MTRRDLSLLIPALAAVAAPAQTTALPSRIYAFDDLPIKKNGQNSSRAILNGTIHEGCKLEMHMTELAPGLAPHAPHHHVHDEVVILRQGTLEVMITGKTKQVSAGSVVYFASGEEHGMKNVGSDNAQYYVVALGKD